MDAILGTAGHIDHGKTSLIRALTGINCDRLDEEKRRGITIELGFAWLDLPDGRRLGIIDVPGHERFVRNMVAGATGIDCMLLVIAADEGVMPQTREHLDICSLLGVRSGIVAITKTDMVEPDWLEMVEEDVRASLKGTFLENAPILPVSSSSGEGLGELRAAIFTLVNSLKPRNGTDLLRLPVDRVFTLKGFGTVITGTIISGNVQQGEELCLTPSGASVRARSLQVHGHPMEQAHTGQRCAINLLGVDVEDVKRGDVVARQGTLFPSRRWVVNLTCLPSSPLPIRQRMEAHFHHGARECAARIVFRDREELAPGEQAIAELHFSEPMAGVFGDHCVLRAHSPLRTIAGGIVLNPLPPLLRKKDPAFERKLSLFERLARLAQSSGQTEQTELVEIALELCGLPGADVKRLAALTAMPCGALNTALAELQKAGRAICWDQEEHWWAGKDAFESSISSCRLRAEELHGREPLKGYFAHKAFQAGWGDNLPSKYCQQVINAALKRGILKQEANGLKLAEHKISLNEDQSELISSFLQSFEKGDSCPPTLKELCEQLGIDARKAMPLVTHLCETGQLVKIQEGLYYHKPALEKIIGGVKSWFGTHDSLDIGDMKTIFGISRKFAIPLLEYLDASRITIREGNVRKLRKS